MTTFGVHTGLQHTTTDELVGLWRRIEAAGYGWISIWDHFYAADLTGDPHCLEAVSAHAALACTTERVRCGSLVYSVGYRHPAVLANAAATIDHLSHGRADLGLGAGWSQVEYDAYGIPFPAVGTRMDQLEEAVQCVRALLHGDGGTDSSLGAGDDPPAQAFRPPAKPDGHDFEGRWFTLRDARCAPAPVQPRLPIWVGGSGERRTLPIAARFADGWNVPFVAPDTFAAKRAVLHRCCEEAGRDPTEIRCAVNVGLAWREEDVEPQFGAMRAVVLPGVLRGSEQQVIDRIGTYVDAGADQVNIALRAYGPTRGDRPNWDVEGLERLAAALGLG